MKEWHSVEDKPLDGQKVFVLFEWNDCPQLAGGTYHDCAFYQDAGDLECEIKGVVFWMEAPIPPQTEYGLYDEPWIE